MRKAIKAIVSCLLAGCSMMQFAACKDKEIELKGIQLDYFDASKQSDGSMDSQYFYRNDLNVFGGDADVIWVPEDRHVSQDGEDEYGGWYYMYTSGNDGVEMITETDHKASISCLRSRDLNDWELCGAVDNGYSLLVGKNQSECWIKSHTWAPEVRYEANTEKYYMFFNAIAYDNPGEVTEEVQYYNTKENFYDNFYMCIAASDTPVGPFRILTSEDYYADLYGSREEAIANLNAEQQETFEKTGKIGNLSGKYIDEKNPQVNFGYDLNLDYVFVPIDLDPFFAEDGTLYVYFSRHGSTGHASGCLWGMKFKDFLTPDYESLTMITERNYEYVTDENVTERTNESQYTLHNCFALLPSNNKEEELRSYLESHKNGDSSVDQDGNVWEKDADGRWEKSGYNHESGINEGPYMYYKDGRYFLCYSPRGFSWPNYDVKQAISDSPLGVFMKLPTMPGSVMSRGYGTYTSFEMSGTGHNALIEKDGELFCIYFAHSDPYNGNVSSTDGRAYAFDRVFIIDDPTYGKLLYGNGPTKTVQYKPNHVTGMHNVAPDATVTVSNGDKDSAKYLNDELFVVHEYFKYMEFTSDGKTQITLKFDQPKTIAAVMVYNTFMYEYAFSKIDSILFKVEERPSWLADDVDFNGYAFIKDVGFNTDYIKEDTKQISFGAASVASFKEIKVSEITITVSQKIDTSNQTIKISDIVVLGK